MSDLTPENDGVRLGELCVGARVQRGVAAGIAGGDPQGGGVVLLNIKKPHLRQFPQFLKMILPYRVEWALCDAVPYPRVELVPCEPGQVRVHHQVSRGVSVGAANVQATAAGAAGGINGL